MHLSSARPSSHRRAAKLGVVLAAAALLGSMATSGASAGGLAGDQQAVEPAADKTYDPMTRAEWTIEPSTPAGLTADSPTQDVMSVVADRIYEMGAERGFTGQRTDYDKRAIAVLWKGTPPADVLAYMESRPLGVTVTVTGEARYSRSELETARARLLNSKQAAALNIISTDLNDDGSGFTIGVTQRETLTANQMADVRATAGIEQVAVKTGVKPMHLFSRPNDSDPWWGGARTQHDNAGLCTSGFAVLEGGSGRLLGARHCDPSGDGLVEDGDGQNIAPAGGSAVRQWGSIDSLLIDPSASPATDHYIYRGAWDSGAGSGSKVKGWASNWPGDPVCTSGASMGEHCGEVYDDSDTHYVNGWHVGVIQVSDDSPMGGQGDSGGPMFKKVSGGVQARGILLGGDESKPLTTNCGETADDAQGISCSRYIDYVPISTILNTWDVTLETG